MEQNIETVFEEIIRRDNFTILDMIGMGNHTSARSYLVQSSNSDECLVLKIDRAEDPTH